MLEFAKQAMGAEEKLKMEDGGRVMHAEVRIGDSLVMLGENTDATQQTRSMLYVYVPDVEAAYRSGLAAGAESLEEPADQVYGDRRAAFTDPFGNRWFVAKSLNG
jgi:uncharacterized glyoxalase superfamily protein PhnB